MKRAASIYSVTYIAQASAGVAGPCFAMGEAAGMAAAMSAQGSGPMHVVEVQTLQAILATGGAIHDPKLICLTPTNIFVQERGL